MQQVQIVPEKIYPNPGKKYAVIEYMNVRYRVPGAYAGLFQQGVPANIGVEVQNWAKSHEPPSLQNIVTSINGQGVTGQQGPVRGGDRPAPVTQSVPQSDKEEGMFIMGVVGRAMGSGKFEMSQIPELTKFAAQAWKDRHTPYPQEQDHGLGNNPVAGEQTMHQGPDPYDEAIPF